MSHVLGIDVSSHAIDMVKLDETSNRAEWTRHELKGKTAFDRLRQVPAAMPLASFYDDVYLTAIETPKTRFMPSAAALFPVYGAVIAHLPARMLVWDVHPKTWRHALGLPGNATKEQVAAAVNAILIDTPGMGGFGYIAWEQDAKDAYGVALYARDTNRRGIEAA